MSKARPVRMSWITWAAILILLPIAAIAFGAWYALAVPGTAHEGPLPDPTAEERNIATRLRTHVMAVASEPHNIKHYAALERSAQYIERSLEEQGYPIQRQIFTVAGRLVRNIEAIREPQSTSTKTQTLVVGAHYDSCDDAPGANDNGTGVAATLELARLLKDWKPEKIRVRFVLFVNEEPPYFRTPDMGSWRYAKLLSEHGERVRGMISLETMGYFSDKPGSQEFPPPFGLIYPSVGNFIAFVGLPASRSFLHEVIGSFRKHTAFPSIGGVAPDAIPGIGWSDHWAFRKYGFPAIMLTDTAPFRYPHYHQPTDTPDKVDYARLARITKGLERVVREIAR
jgi:Zn-dependent M28 family amino/carboxypeptidase